MLRRLFWDSDLERMDLFQFFSFHTLVAANTGTTRLKRARATGPEPHSGKVGSPRQSSGGASAAFDFTVLVVEPAGLGRRIGQCRACGGIKAEFESYGRQS